MKTNLVRQRSKSDCVVAAIASVAGASYAEVKRACGPIRGGLEAHEVDWLLSEFGSWKRCRYRKADLSATVWAARHPEAKAVLLVDGLVLCGGGCHAVASIQGRIFDPSDGSEGSNRRVLESYILLAAGARP